MDNTQSVFELKPGTVVKIGGFPVELLDPVKVSSASKDLILRELTSSTVGTHSKQE